MKILLLIPIVGLTVLCIHSSEKKEPRQPITGELTNITPEDLDILPKEIILSEIMPKLDDKTLSRWAQSSKKYKDLFKRELEIRKYFHDISDKNLKELYTNPAKVDLHLQKLIIPEGHALSEHKELTLPAAEEVKKRAEIEIERRLEYTNMLKQREEFKVHLLDTGYAPGLTLYLNESNIKILYKGVFDTSEFREIKTLQLEHNQLSQLNKDAFKGLENLKWLHLYDNQLTTLDKDTFKGFTNLNSLKLDGNKLTQLDKDAFKGLTNLNSLKLDGNKLTQLDKDAFKGLENLRYLNLEDNKLTTLDKDTFKELANLKELDLSDNNLTTLDKDTFKELANLVELDLSDNQLTQLDKAIFINLTKLQKLRLNNNNLATLDIDTFKNLRNLKALVLKGNPLSREQIIKLRESLPNVVILF